MSPRASESRICPTRNPAVCAQIGCYLSAAGDRAHSGARAPPCIYTPTHHPSTRTRTLTTYKREMRTLPILVSRRSPGASFKLPNTPPPLSLFLSLSLHIHLPLSNIYPSSLSRIFRPFSAVVVRRILATRKLDLPQLFQRIVKIDRKLHSPDRRCANSSVGNKTPIILPIRIISRRRIVPLTSKSWSFRSTYLYTLVIDTMGSRHSRKIRIAFGKSSEFTNGEVLREARRKIAARKCNFQQCISYFF